MPKTWYQSYLAITDFIASHAEIKIEPSVVRIDESVSDEFYQLHWNAREEFVLETNKALLDEAEIISQKYMQLREDVIKLLGIEKIIAFPRIEDFLNNPKGTLAEELFDLFFDLLKGNVDITRYEEQASSLVYTSFDSYYQQSYEIWLVLSLIKLLEADESFRIDTDQFDNDEYFAHGPGGGARLPAAKELKMLSFRHNWVIGILVADQIVHSSKYGMYYSFRPQIVIPMGEVGELQTTPTNRECLSLPVDIIKYMKRNAILVYTDKELEELSFIADKRRICRPDLIIECFALNKLFNENSISQITSQHNGFKPKLGTYVISRDQIQEQMPETGSKPNDIHFLSVGFDQSKLEGIISLITANKP
jgi:hypothetical protein